jgi:long-chain acyl-CoA synthetase
MLANALKLSRSRYPEKPAIVYGRQSWTYAAFDDLTDKIALNLRAAGLEPGDRIAFHLPNGPELALGYFGCLKSGCIAVPINTRLKGPEIDYILRHSGSMCYVGEPGLYGEVVDSCPAVETLELRYLAGTLPASFLASFESLMQPSVEAVSALTIPGDQTAVILYTSGTTARPKGVMHSHASLAQLAVVMHDMRLDQDQVAIIMSSMAHMIGFGMALTSGLVNGATLVITRPFDFESVFRAYEEWGGTYTLGLPVMFNSLLQAYLDKPRNLSSGRFYFCGGDSVSSALSDAFKSTLGTVCEVYGATEMAPAAWNRPDDVRVGSVGRPAYGSVFRLVDCNGNDVQAGKVGEICIQGPHLMTGYWQDPDATAGAIQNGWFHTGDLAYCDPDGFYWFTGRKKEIIIRGGSNISPQEVEATLYQHPAVAEAAVVGRPDPLWGEAVIAFVSLRPGKTATEAELIAFARERLADYKTPESIRFRTELPKSPTGKIFRRALREAEPALASLS